MSDDAWPTLDRLAYYGPLGGFVLDAAPCTEADPAAVLVSGLVALGALIGRGPHCWAGDARHGVNLDAVIVGESSKARKGTSWAVTGQLLEVLDEDFAKARVMSGFGSGEKLVDELAGAQDKRLLVVESEFSRVLRVCARDGSVLSQVIRDSWDGRPLQVRSRTKTSVAGEHHVSCLGHITVEELKLRLSDTDVYSGFANRFLWCCARRQGSLPAGGNVPTRVVADHGRALADAVADARHTTSLHRSAGAEDLWAELYGQMGNDDPGGLLGAAISRDAPQVLRISNLYALLDRSGLVEVPHLLAASSVWQYCRASAAMVFGDLQGDSVTDRLLAAIRRAGRDGLDSKGQFEALGRHVTGAQLAVARRVLEERGLIVTTTERTGGRNRLVSYPCEKSE